MMNKKDPYCSRTQVDIVAFTPHVYEIHGNVNYMHCSNEDEDHSLNFLNTPTIEEFNASRRIFSPYSNEERQL